MFLIKMSFSYRQLDAPPLRTAATSARPESFSRMQLFHFIELV